MVEGQNEARLYVSVWVKTIQTSFTWQAQTNILFQVQVKKPQIASKEEKKTFANGIRENDADFSHSRSRLFVLIANNFGFILTFWNLKSDIFLQGEYGTSSIVVHFLTEIRQKTCLFMSFL